jgi:hypothetical protein
MKLSVGIVATVLVASLTIYSLPVYAQNNVGSIITTSPISLDLTAKPGSSVSTMLQVENDSSRPMTLTVKLEEFRASGSDGQAQIYSPPKNTPSLSWVHFSKTKLTAQPNLWNSIKMSINLPKSAALGYYYAVLFVPNSGFTTKSNANIKGANAVLILLDAQTPSANDSLVIKDFESKKTIYQYLPASFSINVANQGNIYTAPQGDIYISRTINGPTIDTIPINSSQGNVLPKSNRIFNVSWSNGFPVYQYKRYHNQILTNKNGSPITELSWNFHNSSEFRIGKYYARLVLVYNNGIRDIPVESAVAFWVLPWELIIAFVVIIFIFLLGIWTLFRNFFKKVFNSFSKKKFVRKS